MTKFSTPEKVHTVTATDVAQVLEDVTAERDTKGSRDERIALRLSGDTLADLHALGDALGMRSKASQRIMLPDVIKAALGIACLAVNGETSTIGAPAE